MKGFLLARGGEGEPSGSFPLNCAKFMGVSSLELAGGGRPVSFAMAVRIQRSTVNMPSTEPSVDRRFPNCSATETMASNESVCSTEEQLKLFRLTEETRMSGHIRALQHLSEASKRANNAFNDLESGLGALAEALGETLVLWSTHAAVHASSHAAVRTASIHATSVHAAPVHASAHTTAVHAAAYTSTHASKAGVW